MRIHPRVAFAAVAAFCISALAAALFFQHVEQLQPCPLCIIQRYGYLLIGLVSIAAVVHNPGLSGRMIYSGALTLVALAGAGVAVRQVWLIRHPLMMCGPGLEALLDKVPLTHWMPWMFRGTGDCAADTWRFLGLAIPEMSLLAFAALASVGLFFMVAAGFELRGRHPLPSAPA